MTDVAAARAAAQPDSYLYGRDLGDGRGVWVLPLIGGRARVIVGGLTDGWSTDGW